MTNTLDETAQKKQTRLDGRTPAPASGGRLPRWLLFATSFLGGFQIMALEICGFRVLQTTLGSSVVVTGTLLTIMMVLLSAGYYVGGLSSRRMGSVRTLFGALAFSALYSCVASGYLLEPISELGVQLRSAFNDRYLRSGVPAAVLTLLFYGLPVFLMSMISPYWIRIQTLVGQGDGADAGVQSGVFMSLSTVGSIVGTMLASYVLLPLAGVSFTAVSTSLMFFAVTAVGYVYAGTSVRRAAVQASAVAVFLLSGLVLATFALPLRASNVVHQTHSLYGEIIIEKERDAAGRERLVYHPSRVYTHSVLYDAEPLRDFEGITYLVPALVHKPSKILVLGSAVGGILRAIEVAFPQALTVGVDIDPAVHRVATDIFRVNTQRARLVSADARIFLEEDRERYDLIIVDLFAGEFIPTHCITRQFFELVAGHLAPAGNVFINTNMYDAPYELSADAEPSRPVRHLHATLRAAGFGELYENRFFHSIFAFPHGYTLDQLQHDLTIQLENTELLPALRAIAGTALYSTLPVPQHNRDYSPYTDAWAPALSIESKSNTASIYAAVARSRPTDDRMGGALGQLFFDEEWTRWDRHHQDEPELHDVVALVRALDHASALPEVTLERATRYLRFSHDLPEFHGVAQSRWGKVAELYARIWRHGLANDYEELFPVFRELRSLLNAN